MEDASISGKVLITKIRLGSSDHYEWVKLRQRRMNLRLRHLLYIPTYWVAKRYPLIH
jgi:hypothetical protein